MLWSSNAGTAPLQAQLIQYNLKQIGLDAEIRLLPRAQQFTNAGNLKTADFDMTIERWGADYADPYDFVNVLLDGNRSPAQHNNYAYFDVAKFNKQTTAASLLTGPRRGTARRGARRCAHAGEPAWAPPTTQRPDLSCPRGWLRDDQRDHGHGSAAQRALPEVTGERHGRGGLVDAPPRPTTRPTDAQLPDQTTAWAGVLFIGVTLITYVLFFQLPRIRDGSLQEVRHGRGRRTRLAPARARLAGTSSTCSS